MQSADLPWTVVVGFREGFLRRGAGGYIGSRGAPRPTARLTLVLCQHASERSHTPGPYRTVPKKNVYEEEEHQSFFLARGAREEFMIL